MQHHDLFKVCYKDRKMLYKHHHVIHYGTLLQCSGPPRIQMMVMHFEAKRNFLERLCSFQKISYSVANRR
jgi:hypothetical protein